MRQTTYKLRVPDGVAELVREMHPHLKNKIKASLKVILSDPDSGKALKEELAGLRSFRVSRFRIIYKLSQKREVVIVAIGPRKRIYEETFRILNKMKKSKNKGPDSTSKCNERGSYFDWFFEAQTLSGPIVD